MIFLWVFGNAVNYKFRHLGYMALYALAAFAGGMAHYLFNGTPVLGASGAICGIMGAFLVFFPRNDVTCVWLFGIFGSSFTLSSGWIILYWVVWDVGCLALGSSHNVAY
jgi:membrane associated rhomboid family serine protease